MQYILKFKCKDATIVMTVATRAYHCKGGRYDETTITVQLERYFLSQQSVQVLWVSWTVLIVSKVD
jgi:hypothetical protein